MLITETKSFSELMVNTASNIIEYLFNNNKEFYIYCDLENIEFNPELPKDISDSFEEYIIFGIVNYSYETAELDDDFLTFQAGFGEDFESQVIIPLESIMHINVDEETIFINMSTYEGDEEEIIDNNVQKVEQSIGQNRSMNSFMNNPENKHLFKK